MSDRSKTDPSAKPGRSSKDLETHRVEPRHPDDVESEPDRSTSSVERPPADVNKGREYQGTGIMNREGRFGSSDKPADPGQKSEKRSG